ncbi:MAG: asparaginase [Candidatus Nanopelagicaceae bacterium]|nr:asparaginase [Candidatus Nanopelagicaceae bacterium]
MKTGEVLLEVVRNDLVESVHAGHLMILDAAGKTVLQIGDVDSIIYPRSAVKSLQASAMLRAGAKLTDQQIALACASHAGSAQHLAVAISTLASVGLDESALRNTPDKPLDPKERVAWGDKAPSSLAANCSGKHSAMLATCVANNWDINTYKNSTHPLQIAIKNEFEELSGEKISKVAVDGCGAPLFALTLKGLANAVRNLSISTDPIHQRVISACITNPVLVSGVGRLPTLLMEKVNGLFVKDGAEGVMIIATNKGEVIVWKMSDGSQRGAGALAVATLSQLGISVDIEREKVLGDGQVVGEIRASKLVSNG